MSVGPRTPGVAPCGTNGGYQAHLVRGESPCPDCMDAKAAYQREYRRRRPDKLAHEAKRRSALRRARRRLAELHAPELAALLAEERRRVGLTP